MRGALPSAEAQVAALTAALLTRYPRLWRDWSDERVVRLRVRAGGRDVGVALAIELVVLAPAEALAAELGPYFAALLTRRSLRPPIARPAAPGRRHGAPVRSPRSRLLVGT